MHYQYKRKRMIIHLQMHAIHRRLLQSAADRDQACSKRNLGGGVGGREAGGYNIDFF